MGPLQFIRGIFFPSTPERSQKHSALPCLLCARLLRCQAAHLEECSSQRAVTPLLGSGNSSCGGSDSQHPQGTPWGWHSSIIAPLDQFGMDTLLLPRTKPRCGAGVPWRGCAPAWKCRFHLEVQKSVSKAETTGRQKPHRVLQGSRQAGESSPAALGLVPTCTGEQGQPETTRGINAGGESRDSSDNGHREKSLFGSRRRTVMLRRSSGSPRFQQGLGPREHLGRREV